MLIANGVTPGAALIAQHVLLGAAQSARVAALLHPAAGAHAAELGSLDWAREVTLLLPGFGRGITLVDAIARAE